MNDRTARLAVEIVGNSSSAVSSFDSARGGVSKLDSGLRAANGAAIATVAALGAAALATGNLASDAEQSIGGVQAVFGRTAGAVEKFAATSAQSVGLSSTEYRNLATVMGAQLRNGGTSVDEMAGKTNALISVGADMAAAFGGSTSDAVGALSSALRGERDPIEKYGVALTQAAVDAKAAELGFTKVGGSLSTEASQAATLALIMEQTSSVHGQFASEADTAAGAQQRSTAALADAGAALGTAFLPAMTQAANILGQFANWASENTTVVLALAAGVGLLALGVIGYNAVMTIMPAIQAAATAAQWLLNVALNANPIGIVILAVAALVGALVWLWNTNETFRTVLIAAWEGIKIAVAVVANFFTTTVPNAFRAMATWVMGHINRVISIVKLFIAANVKLAATIGQKISQIVAFVRRIPQAFTAAATAAGAKIISLISWVAGIPGRIRSAIGNAGNILRRAGGAIIEGFLSGLRAKFAAVQNFVSGIGSWIAAHKGPLSYDRTLLTPAGGAIMDGLVTGLAAGMPALERQLDTVTGTIAGTSAEIDAPDLKVTARAGGQQQPINITINGALDPPAVARQLRTLINSDARLRGATPLNGTVLA